MRRTITVLILLPLVISVSSCGSKSSSPNQPTDQPTVQLSPEESQASQTVTDFLDMCEQDQIQGAIDRYVEVDSRFPRQDALTIFQDMVHYSIDYASSDTSTPTPFTVVGSHIRTKQGGAVDETDMQIICSQDGTHIQNLGVMMDALWHGSPEEKQAMQMAVDFLDMCQQGQVQEAIDKYVKTNPWAPLEDIGFLNNIVDYTVDEVSSNAAVSNAPPDIVVELEVRVKQGESVVNTGAQLWCNQDGTSIFQVLGNLKIIDNLHRSQPQS